MFAVHKKVELATANFGKKTSGATNPKPAATKEAAMSSTDITQVSVSAYPHHSYALGCSVPSTPLEYSNRCFQAFDWFPL